MSVATMIDAAAPIIEQHEEDFVTTVASALAAALTAFAVELEGQAEAIRQANRRGAVGKAQRLDEIAVILRERAGELERHGPAKAAAVSRMDKLDAFVKDREAANGDGPACGATWQANGFDPCTLPAGEHGIHQGKTSKWPREPALAADAGQVFNDTDADNVAAFLAGEVELKDLKLAGEHDGVPVTKATPAESDEAQKITAGVLEGFSVGIENPRIVNGGPPTGVLTIPMVETSVIEGVPVDPFSEPVANGGRPYWLPEPNPRPYIPVDSPAPLAVHQSDIKLGEECGLALRLKYRDRVAGVPTWWNEGGHAFHACIERFERLWLQLDDPQNALAQMSDETAREWFNTALDRQIAELTEQTGFGTRYWRAANKGTEGEAWWRENGPHTVRDYVAWSSARHADGWFLAQVYAGTPGIQSWTLALEARFSYMLHGRLIEGTIDQIWVRQQTDRITRDVAYEVELIDPKSSKDVTSDPLQLAVYGRAVPTLLPDVPIVSLRAAYYDGRAGRLLDLIDPLTAMDEAELSYRAETIVAMHQTNVYPANPGTEYGKPCGICEFRYACPIMARRDA